MKYYNSNPHKYRIAIISIVILTAFISIFALGDLKENWLSLIFAYFFISLLIIIILYYRQVVIAINEDGIEIKYGDNLNKAKWSDIIELKELLFAPGGELSYKLITKNKKSLVFTTAIRNCDDLIREIETRTGLKFKQRL